MKNMFPAVLGALVGIVIITPALSDQYVIEVYNDSAGKMILRRPAVPGDPFSFEYTNSVDFQPVVENFTFDKRGEIILTDQFIKEHAYGLPETFPEDHWRVVEGKIHIYDLKRRIGTIVLRVSFLNDQFLVFNGLRLNLTRVARGGQRIIVSVHRLEE